MRRIVTAFAAALCLAACGNADTAREVSIPTDEVRCFAGAESGVRDTLVADATYGTAFSGKQVVWPTDYTAWRGPDGEVTVLDASGDVKAITGRTYYISVAWAASLPLTGDGKYVAAAECSMHWDFIDCTANPADELCKSSAPRSNFTASPPSRSCRLVAEYGCGPGPTSDVPRSPPNVYRDADRGT